MNLEKIDFFRKSIPQENKESESDFSSSVLFKGVADFLQGHTIEARQFLMAISSFCNIKNPIEWQCYEWSSFLLLYIDHVDPLGKDAQFFVKKYKKRLIDHLYLRKKFYIDFYFNKSINEIRKEIKGGLRRRWGKKFLNRCIIAADEATKEGDVNTEWVEIASCLIESIYLMYVVGNVSVNDVEIIINKAKKILKGNNAGKLAPFVDFYL